MNIKDIPSLQMAVQKGEPLRFLFFWGHHPRKDGSIGKSCLSQWWPAEFTVDGIRYRSAEQFLMAEKARLFEDIESARLILEARSPEQAKKLGRKVKGFDNAVWETERVGIAERANLAKFSQNPELMAFLLSTVDSVLVEASPVDAIWGIGLAEKDPAAHDPALWKGMNLLGFALMEVRSRLQPQ